MALLVYVDLIFTSDDADGIVQVNDYLARQFVMNDLGKLRYFLGIEFATSKQGTIMLQRKYALDILQETGMLGSKDANIPMDPKIHLFEDNVKLKDKKAYQQLVGKLLYLSLGQILALQWTS